MNKFRDIPTIELKTMWEQKRNEMLKKGVENCSKDEMKSLYEIRKEIERRKGNSLPPKNINYSDYLTD